MILTVTSQSIQKIVPLFNKIHTKQHRDHWYPNCWIPRYTYRETQFQFSIKYTFWFWMMWMAKVILITESCNHWIKCCPDSTNCSTQDIDYKFYARLIRSLLLNKVKRDYFYYYYYHFGRSKTFKFFKYIHLHSLIRLCSETLIFIYFSLQ